MLKGQFHFPINFKRNSKNVASDAMHDSIWKEGDFHKHRVLEKGKSSFVRLQM